MNSALIIEQENTVRHRGSPVLKGIWKELGVFNSRITLKKERKVVYYVFMYDLLAFK